MFSNLTYSTAVSNKINVACPIYQSENCNIPSNSSTCHVFTYSPPPQIFPNSLRTTTSHTSFKFANGFDSLIFLFSPFQFSCNLSFVVRLLSLRIRLLSLPPSNEQLYFICSHVSSPSSSNFLPVLFLKLH